MPSFAEIVLVHVLFAAVVNAAGPVSSSNAAFNPELIQEHLDPEECQRQLTYLRNNGSFITAQFLDASWRVPRNFFKSNRRDLGNYFQCLEINENIVSENMNIEGKYCTISVSPDSINIDLPGLLPVGQFDEEPWIDSWRELSYLASKLPESTDKAVNSYANIRYSLLQEIGLNTTAARTGGGDIGMALNFQLAVCIPKVCTTREALDSFTGNLTSMIGFTENSCRINNDKQWVAADTVAVVVFSIIGLLIIMSTLYDIWHTILLENESSDANKLYQSFSVYTNTKNFFVFPSGPKVVSCLEGIRAISMLWVIVAHTFSTQLNFMPENMLDAINALTSFSGLWILSAPIAVDTFFLLSGVLLVYTTVSKVTRNNFLRNLHLFYFNRILRMFPILAFTILAVASFMYRLSDGPDFNPVANWVDNCRANWWSTLLYVQNWATSSEVCLGHSWYLAIDMQLYVLSPLVIFWLLGEDRRLSWAVLLVTLASVLAAATAYNFHMEFQSGFVALSRFDFLDYMTYYYINTLTRAAPFIVGMIFGYLLHIYKGKRIEMPLVQVLALWVVAFGCTTIGYITPYWNVQADWDNQLMDNLLNSFKRPIWAAGIGLMIFACQTGYGGPVNWFLSLTVFKILGRLSYAMYMVHYPLIFLAYGSRVTPSYFAMNFNIYRFFSDFMITLIIAFIVTICIDFPFSNLIKLALEKRKPRQPVKEVPVEPSSLEKTAVYL